MPFIHSLVCALLLFAVATLLLSPFLYMLLGSLHAPGTPMGQGFWAALSQPTLAAYHRVFSWVPMASGLMNSVWQTAVAVLLTVLSASLTAFAMTQLAPAQRQRAVLLLIVVASVPLTALWVPRFVMFQGLGLAQGAVPVIAPALFGASPLFVLLYFVALRRVPGEVFEAARLEGLSTPAVWWRVALPLVRPTTLAVATLAAMQFWGGFQEPLLYLKREHQLTAPLLLHALDLLGPTEWAVLMAGAALVTAPVVLAFFAVQGLFGSAERHGAGQGK